MTRTASERVKGLFAVWVEDWTPSAVRGEVQVFFSPILSDAEATENCRTVLSEAEVQRATRFLRDGDKTHFIQRRAFRRYCGGVATGSLLSLSEIEFQETDQGHPYLAERPDLWFSFSSCRLGFLGAWSSTKAIGVDLEDRTREVEAVDLAARFFTHEEAKAVAGAPSSPQTFLQLWSLKEAALKSIGEGLPYGLDAFEFELTSSVRLVDGPAEFGGADAFYPHLINRRDSYAAVVVREPRDDAG